MNIKRIFICFLTLTCFSVTLCFAQSYLEDRDNQKQLIEAFVNLQGAPEPLATRLIELKTAYEKGEIKDIHNLGDRLATHYLTEKTPDGSVIPYLIALIEADNSYDTVYGIGHFGLGQITGVEYSSFHDGAFWRCWWEKNKNQFSEEVQNIKIPELPKTRHGKTYKPYPEELETLDGKLKFLRDIFNSNKPLRLNKISDLAQGIAQHEDPKAIPYLIAAIEADNSYDTVYMVGYFGLGKLTDVRYSEMHDGAFWRRWWEKNKTGFPEEVQNIEIPELPKTRHGKTYISPYPENIDTLAGQLEYLRLQFAKDGKKRFPKKSQAGDQVYFVRELLRSIVEFDDPTAIPFLISVIEAEDIPEIQRYAGSEGIDRIAQIRDTHLRDAAWWKNWWNENKKDFPESIQKIDIPNINDPWNVPDLSKKIAEWRAEKKSAEEKEALSDVADIPCERLHAPEHERMEYFLIGPKPNGEKPKSGYKLVVVLPGGDGSAEFNPFVRRMLKYAMKEDYIIAQPIAVKWTPKQQIVWPTESNAVEKQEFSTEQFIEAVIADVSKKVAINPKHVFTLSWSSSGPAAYAAALQENTAITGSYICMSVFKPNELPPLDRAKDRVFLIDHSPDDRVCPFRMAKEAEEKLNAHGAILKFTEYPGGHGWRGNLFGRLGENLDWIEKNTD